MYRHLYGLTEKPFQISTDPTFLWLGGKHREALAVLVYGVRDSRGFLLLSGGVGTGKTTLIRSLLGQLDKNVAVATVQDPGLTPMEFFNFIAAAYGMRRRYTNKVDFLFDFEKFLRKTRAAGRNALLIVDEAQRLDQTLLEEIRLLSNIEDPDQKLLNVFFVGQEEFLDIIASPENRALKQRITINYHLETLSPDETEKLVRHRLKVAGATREIFTPDAFPLIHEFSQGAPRLINILCDHALLTGFVKDIDTIGAATITECIEDLILPGEHPHHLPISPPETGVPPRPVAATVAAGMMLQNEPSPPRRARWPWAAAAGLLLAVGIGIVMHQGWLPLDEAKITAQVAPSAVKTPPPPESPPAATTPAPPETTSDEPPPTAVAPEIVGNPSETNTPFAPRPSRSTAMESAKAQEEAPSHVETSERTIAPPLPSSSHRTDHSAEILPMLTPDDKPATTIAAPSPSDPEGAGTDSARPSATADVLPGTARSTPRPSETPDVDTAAPSSSLMVALENAAASPAVLSPSTEDRLRDFIRAYAQAYESRDLERFRLFFTDDAVENGRPFSKVLPVYQKNFAALSGLEYTIKLMSWKKKDATGGITLKGAFDVRYHMPNRDWRTTQGKITMDLVSNGGVYRVKRLNYSLK